MQEKSRYMEENKDIIYDSKTSLTWAAKDSRQELEKDLTWDEAQSYKTSKNGEKLGGYSDWRIPTIQEALSLFDPNRANKDFKGGEIHIDSIFPLGAGFCTWTSSEREREAQIIFYLNGCAYWYEKNDNTISHSVRLVRR